MLVERNFNTQLLLDSNEYLCSNLYSSTLSLNWIAEADMSCVSAKNHVPLGMHSYLNYLGNLPNSISKLSLLKKLQSILMKGRFL